MLGIAAVPRAQPLTPGAVLALGATSWALAARLVALPDGQLGPLRAVLGDELLLLLGNEQDLPWSDGVIYLGREPMTPELWLPCAIEPNVPASLLLRALRSRFQTDSLLAPFAVSLEPPVVVPLVDAQPLTRELIGKFRGKASDS